MTKKLLCPQCGKTLGGTLSKTEIVRVTWWITDFKCNLCGYWERTVA